MIHFRRVRCVVAAMAVVALSTGRARGDDSVELERGKNSYDGGQYQEGAERFRVMLDPDSPHALKDPAAVERARVYYAACLIALGRLPEADAQIERIFRQNPLYAPDPVIFPGKVTDRFTDIRARFKSAIEAELRAKSEAERAAREHAEQARREQQRYITELQEIASHEIVVVRNSRSIAALPFGVGQFQNGQPALGFTFLISETLAAGTSVIAGAIWQSLVVQSASPGIDVNALNDRLATARAVSLYSMAAFAGLGIGGILQAQLSFVPQVIEQRERPLPKPPQIGPTAAWLPGGGYLGVAGRF